MSKRPQEGNLAWKAARLKSQFKKGGTSLHHRRCEAKRQCNGERCKATAVKGMRVCYMHGGQLGLATRRRAKLKREQKLRYAAWTNPEAISNGRRGRSLK